MNLESQWTKVAGGMVHSLSSSHSSLRDTRIVVLVHGLVISSRYMVPTAELLASLCQVHAVDLPGYGKSYKPPNILSLAQLSDALADWMRAKEIPRASLIANSFGCQILAEFALRHAQRVERLVLQGPTVDPQARSVWQQLGRLIINSPRERRSLGWITLLDYRSAGLRRAWATVQLALQDKIEEKLPHIQAPVLVVRGEKDPLVPQRWAEEVRRLLPHGKLCVIPGAAHTVNYSAPKEFVAAMRPFLGI
jgi:2-hydroxy-6-oxonona-2,4-dienedioate hydrolase